MSQPAVDAAERSLRGPRYSIDDAFEQCPDLPGLYAVYGTELAWTQLGLRMPGEDAPLYVGKAEDSLVRRDMRTHFATGRTGSSTLRRSLAALLRDELELRAIPRNSARPGHFANFAIDPDGDARLTAWMRVSLTIAFWPHSMDCKLSDVESAVLAAWSPPLNLAKIRNADPRLRSARQAMADEARRWSSS